MHAGIHAVGFCKAFMMQGLNSYTESPQLVTAVKLHTLEAVELYVETMLCCSSYNESCLPLPV